MFQHVLTPARSTAPERGMTLMLTLALLFVVVSIWAFARAAHAPEARALIASAPGNSVVECKTADGTVVLVGEIRAAIR